VHLELLVEELSAEAALQTLLPTIVGPDVTFAIHPFRGKNDLLRKLPARLRAYSKWVHEADTRIAVLLDEDRQDCKRLKAQVEEAATVAGLATKSSVASGEPFVIVNRLAVEELEAWFFGDIAALRMAYPRVPATVEGRAAYRDPDEIAGGTWEALERVLQAAGYHRGGLAKVTAARDIALHMHLDRNRSSSFQRFREGLEALVAAPQPSLESSRMDRHQSSAH
jgi:hypothetical protein